MIILQYANNWEDCGSTKHRTIRYIIVGAFDPTYDITVIGIIWRNQV